MIKYNQGESIMSNSEKVAKDLLAAWETHNLNRTANLLAYEFELTGVAPQPLFVDTFLMFQRVHNEAFPDWKFNVSETRLEDNKVYLTTQITATHSGIYDLSKLGIVLPPVMPTGHFRTWPVEYITCTVKKGRITQMEVETGPEGGLIGTLAWLGIKLSTTMMPK
jgi:hypothetical protein